MKTFSQIVNNKIFEYYGKIEEANVVNWFTDFLKKTSDFITIWQKKGNSKYTVDQSKGTIQANNSEVKLNILQLKKIWNGAKFYKKCYPQTNNWITHEQTQLKPEIIDKNDWDNVSLKMYVYTPEVNYNGENYPCAIGIYPQKKIEVIEGYLHIDSFETSELIMNKEIRNNIFEIFIDDLRKSKGTSYNGITLIPKNPSLYNKYKYKGKSFEEIEIEDTIEEKTDKEKEDEKIVDKKVDTIKILQLTF